MVKRTCAWQRLTFSSKQEDLKKFKEIHTLVVKQVLIAKEEIEGQKKINDDVHVVRLPHD